MTGDRLRIGIIGVGRIAHAHIDAAARLADTVQLTALCSRRAESMREPAARAGVERLYTDYREMLADPMVEGVIVCLPQDLHHEVCLAAAAAGRHVLVEKPMALTAGEAAAVAAAARAGGVTLMVAQSRRFPKAVRELVRRLPEIGDILRIHVLFLVRFREPPAAWWCSAARAGGLVILLQGSHSLDSVVWWAGRMPETVFACASRRNPAWEGEDEADILCRFDDGAVASVHLSLSTDPPLHEAVVVGERGHLRLVERPLGPPFRFAYTLECNGKPVFSEPDSEAYTDQLAEFAAAIRAGRPPLASGAEIVPLMRVLDAARASAASGRPVAP